MRIKFVLITLLAIVSTRIAKAQNILLPLDPAVHTGKLPNGFTYYIRHNEEPKNRVVLYLVNKVGSVLEDEDQRGLAHFMEHMSFNGTKHFPKNELVDYLQKSGVRFGADLNATTNFDETIYQLPIASDNPNLLAGGLRIMRDWAGEATLDSTEINKERGVVLEEKRLGKGAGERMQRVYYPVLMNNSRYSDRIVIGLDTVLNNFTPQTIRRFYHDWYRPDLQALIVVGDINADQMERLIKQQFSDLKNPVHERQRTNYTIPLTGKNQFVAVTDKEMTSTQCEIIIKHLTHPIKTEQDYRRMITQNLFNQMFGERYEELSRTSNPPFIDGSAGISGFIGGLESYNAVVAAKPGELEAGLKAVWRETERVRRLGFTATELERAKMSYLSGIETAVKEKDKTPSESYVNEYVELFLKGDASPGIETEYRLTQTDLKAINLGEVNSIAKEYITNTNKDIVLLAPEKEKQSLPDEATIKSWMKSVEEETFLPYHDVMTLQPLLSEEPKAGSIHSTQKDTALGITTYLLSNGAKVLIKPTDFQNNEILFSAFAPGGTSLASDADYQSAAIAAGLISAGGAGNYNADQLSRYLEGKQLSIQPYIGERFQGFNGNSTREDLETALQLMYAYFTEPRKDTAIANTIIARSKATLVNRSDNPGSVFADTVNAILGNYSTRRTGPTLEKLEQINLDKANSFYRNRFTDAANFRFTFVGSVDTNTIKPLLEKYIGAMPATNQKETAKDLNIHIPVGRIEKTVYKGSEPKANVLMVFSGDFAYTQENNTKLDALKEALQIRLIERLREDESGVYTPGVSASTSKYPQSRYSFIIRFGCAPQNVDKLIASTLDEINKLKNDGPPQVNIDKWRAEEKTSWKTTIRSNDFWIDYLTGQLENEEDLRKIYTHLSVIDQIKPADVEQAAAQYLSGNNYIKLVLLPK